MEFNRKEKVGLGIAVVLSILAYAIPIKALCDIAKSLKQK